MTPVTRRPSPWHVHHAALTPPQAARVFALYWYRGLDIAQILRRTGYRYADIRAAIRLPSASAR